MARAVCILVWAVAAMPAWAVRRVVVASAAALAEAVTDALPGDEIVVRPGEYNVNLVVTRDGTEEAPIYLVAAPDEQVVLSARDPTRRVLELDDASHWVIDGFRLRGSRHAMVRVTGGTDVVIRRCVVSDGMKKGIIANGDLVTIEGCQFHAIQQPVGGEDTQAIAAWRASRLRIHDNVFETPGDGVLIGGAGELDEVSTDVRIYRDHFHERSAWYGVYHVENAIDVKHADGVVIADNVMHHFRGFVGDDPIGVAMNVHTSNPGSTATIDHVRIERNVFHDVARAVAIQGGINGPGRNLVFRRNLVYAVLGANATAGKTPGALFVGDWTGVSIESNTFVDIDGAVVHDFGSLPGLRFVNNTLQRSAGTVREAPGGLFDYTCRFASGDTGGANDVVADPLFLDDGARDYRLAAGSPCIDHGADLGLSYAGAAPDMGCFERWPDGEPLAPDEGAAPAPANADGRPVDWARYPPTRTPGPR